jgi:hypothetical protein
MRVVGSNSITASHVVDAIPGERDSKVRSFGAGDVGLRGVKIKGGGESVFTRAGELSEPSPDLPSGVRGDGDRVQDTSTDLGASLGTEVDAPRGGESW